MNTPEKIIFIKFTQSGDHAWLDNGAQVRGYGSPEKPHASEPTATREIAEGCPVLDIREAVKTPEGFGWVYRGPMVNPRLAPGQIDRLGMPPAYMTTAMLDNMFGTLLAIHTTQTLDNPQIPGSLDTVAVDVFVAGWRAHGARVGRWEAGHIVWEN